MPDRASNDWLMLKEAFVGKAPHQIFSFTNANIINYFVVRTAVDGMPSDDIKAINSRALNLFWSGHIQCIRTRTDKHLLIQANCLPEMRKDRVYKLFLPWIWLLQTSLVLNVDAQQERVYVLAASILVPCAMLWKSLAA